MAKAHVKIRKVFEFETILEGENDEKITQKAKNIPFDKFKEKKNEILLNSSAKKISQFEKRKKQMEKALELSEQIKKRLNIEE